MKNQHNRRSDEEQKKKSTDPYTAQNDVKKVLTVANGITMLRIVGTIGMFFLTPLSPLFLVVYTLTGLTDGLDGWVARKTGTVSEFGARLDSIADLLFCAVMMIRLFSVLSEKMPIQLWYALAGILLVRLGAYCTAAVKYRRFVALHTRLNKLTGVAVFLLPYVLALSSGVRYGWAVCVLAFVASLEELAIHIFRKDCYADTKSFFYKGDGQSEQTHP